jgi:hypothetical protein
MRSESVNIRRVFVTERSERLVGLKEAFRGDELLSEALELSLGWDPEGDSGSKSKKGSTGEFKSRSRFIPPAYHDFLRGNLRAQEALGRAIGGKTRPKSRASRSPSCEPRFASQSALEVPEIRFVIFTEPPSSMKMRPTKETRPDFGPRSPARGLNATPPSERQPRTHNSAIGAPAPHPQLRHRSASPAPTTPSPERQLRRRSAHHSPPAPSQSTHSAPRRPRLTLALGSSWKEPISLQNGTQKKTRRIKHSNHQNKTTTH